MTPFQHIWVKVVAVVLMEVATLVVSLLSLALFTVGDVFVEILKAAAYLVKEVHQVLGNHLAFYVVEFLLLLLLVAFSQMLLYYTCITVGQLFKKNRVAAAVGVYFGYYFLSQVLGTVFSIVVAVTPEEVWEKIGEFIVENIFWCVHGFFGVFAVLSAGMAVAYFAISHAIIRKRLNLE